jgi:hypothetical protein
MGLSEQYGLLPSSKVYIFIGGGGRSGGLLVAKPDCKTAVLGSNPASPQPTVDCQSLDGLQSGMALPCRLSSEGRQRRILTTGTSVPPKTIKEKKIYFFIKILLLKSFLSYIDKGGYNGTILYRYGTYFAKNCVEIIFFFQGLLRQFIRHAGSLGPHGGPAAGGHGHNAPEQGHWEPPADQEGGGQELQGGGGAGHLHPGRHAVVWRDNQPVYMASNHENLEPMGSCQRYCQKKKCYIAVPQPMLN